MTELWQASAAVIAARVKARETSAREEAEAALSRLEAVNGPLNAVVDPLPEAALAEADAVDAKIARGEDPGLLAGVPVTVKINIDYGGRPTTNGLKLLKDFIAPQDSPVVTNLRRAGAVVIGRTNTPAFSLRWFTRNSLHGETSNPHDRRLTPGGSSGGAGSAVAAGIGAVAHGTDIAGSIRYPAYACGVHGLRPSPGRVPAANLSGPDRTIGAQLTAVSGPLARRIEDLRLSLAAMSAEDWRDPWWTAAPLEGPRLPKKAALCLAPEGMAVQPEVAAALKSAAASLEAAGWVVEEAEPPSIEAAAQILLELWMDEFRTSGTPKLEPEGDPDAIFVAAQMMRAVGNDWSALELPPAPGDPDPGVDPLPGGVADPAVPRLGRDAVRAALGRALRGGFRPDPAGAGASGRPAGAGPPRPDRGDRRARAAHGRAAHRQAVPGGYAAGGRRRHRGRAAADPPRRPLRERVSR